MSMHQLDNSENPCGPALAGDSACGLQAEPYGFLLYDANGPGTGDAWLSMIQLSGSPGACSPSTIAGPAITGAIDAPGRMRCVRFPATTGDALDSTVVVTSSTSGSLHPTQEFIDPYGGQACVPTTAQNDTCTLRYTGTYKILIEDAGGFDQGTYTVAISRTNPS